MTTEEKLRYVAVFLADRTADASWLLCDNMAEYILMAAELGLYTHEASYLADGEIIDVMYYRVLKLESE